MAGACRGPGRRANFSLMSTVPYFLWSDDDQVSEEELRRLLHGDERIGPSARLPGQVTASELDAFRMQMVHELRALALERAQKR